MAKASSNTGNNKKEPKAPKAPKEPKVQTGTIEGQPGEGIQMPTMQKHIVTQEDLDRNPDLIAQGVKVGDEVEIPVPEAITAPVIGATPEAGGNPLTATPEPIKPEAPEKSKKKDKQEKSDEEKESEKLAEIMKPYVQSHPTVKKFYRTSDGMVFLGEFGQTAREHQQTVDAKKEPQVYIVK